MESSDLTPPFSDHDRLHAMFREVAPLPDDGFSRRVLAALPAPRSSRTRLWRALVILTGAAAGAALSWRPIAALGSDPADLEALLRSVEQLGTLVSDPRLLLAVTLAAVSLLYAFMTSAREEFKR